MSWVIAIASLLAAMLNFGKPALEIRLGPQLAVSSIKPAHWNNDQQPLDRIVALDGQAVDSPDEVRRLVETKAAPAIFQVTVVRDHHRVSYPVTSRKATWQAFFQDNAPLLLFSLLFLGLGTWVTWMGPKRLEAHGFIFLTIILGLYGFMGVDFDTSQRLWPLYVVVHCLAGSAFLIFGSSFLRPDRLPKWPLWIGAILAVVTLATFPTWEWVRQHPAVEALNYFLFYRLSLVWSGGVGLLGLIGLLTIAFFRSQKSSLLRRQLRLILGSTVISLMPIAYSSVFAQIQGQRPDSLWLTVSLLGLGILPVTMAAAILRFRMYDIEVIVRKTLGYAIAVGGIGILYFGGLTLVSMQAAQWVDQTSLQFAFLLGAVLLLHPLRDHVQRVVDRLFYRDRLDLPLLLQRFEQYGQIDQDQLFEKIAADIQEALRVTVAGIAKPTAGTWQLTHVAGSDEIKGPLLPAELPSGTYFPLDAQLWQGFEAGVRIQLGEQTVAVLLLGPKLSESAYTESDFHYIQLLLAPLSGLIGYSQAKARQKQTELEIARLYEQVAELNQMKDSFSMVTSHELRTPLTVIIGYAETLLDGVFGPLDEQQRESISSIQRHAQKLVNNVNDYLDLMQIQQRRLLLSPRAVDVLTALQEVLPELAPRAAEKSLQFRQYLGSLPSVDADPKRLRQLLFHLLDNAVKFSESGGIVAIEGRTFGNQAIITVRDNGIGIPEDKLPTIFDSFTQVHDPLNRPQGGLGIGLALVKGLAEAMNGDITIVSQSGEGTAVTIRLAVASRDQQPLEGGEIDRPTSRDRHFPGHDGD